VSTAVEEDFDLAQLMEGVIPCSSTSHPDDTRHHDPESPAEWLVRYTCRSCNRVVIRPVCTRFIQTVFYDTSGVRCKMCRNIQRTAISYEVLHRL
jgi:hypothetical protein